MASRDDRLLEFFRRLDTADQSTLLAFAEFLAFRSGPVADAKPVVKQEVAEPEPIPRPEEESVVAAVKRLSKTYPMLNKGEIQFANLTVFLIFCNPDRFPDRL